jgi:hypothetical protein
VYTAVVKFDPLTNPVGAGTQDDDFFFLETRLSLVPPFSESRIEIRCFSFKFRAAGIYHFENTVYAGRRSFLKNGLFISVLHDGGNLRVTESRVFASLSNSRAAYPFIFSDFLFRHADFLDLI